MWLINFINNFGKMQHLGKGWNNGSEGDRDWTEQEKFESGFGFALTWETPMIPDYVWDLTLHNPGSMVINDDWINCCYE